MHLGQDPKSDKWAQQLLHIGITDGDVILPQPICSGDTMASLINSLYSQLLAQDRQLPDQYFLDHTILSSKNEQAHEINAIILDGIAPQEKTTYLSADSVPKDEPDY